MSRQPIVEGALVLADGNVFEGELIGAVAPDGVASGEVVFNTVLSGYQEVLTDPSYAGQIITFTYPHIGNYGASLADFESRRPFCRGVIVRDLARRESNHRSEAHLDATLRRYGISGIAGIDTRRLTRLLRDTGAMSGAFGSANESTLLAAAKDEPGTDGVDLVAQVTTPSAYTVGSGERRIVAYDFGIKYSIVDHLATLGTVTVVPASTTAEEVLALGPSGVFLSNGPGDPEVVGYAVEAIRGLVGQVPVFGICLGHQLLSLAIGGTTFKLPFGHHGGNHPVRHEASGKIEITSQNHNFCVDPESLGDRIEVTHRNLNDHTNEGMWVKGEAAFSVQYHPEAGPGPHDASYLFGVFDEMMRDPADWRDKPRIRRAPPLRTAGLPAPELGLGDLVGTTTGAV
ncbi:MAG: carA [Ilumatobacteraceae bacterium]|nr:carA [Ilumatobacteraceae bacterium]